MSNNPICVLVITYNSAEYVIETLESIKKQTYKKIELIISDDNSKDNTVELCEEWIEENKSRFLKIKILNSEKNEGVVKNINKGIKKCDSEWIKTIAGDDLLEEECLENNMGFVEKNPDAKIIFSKSQSFLEIFNNDNFKEIIPNDTKIFKENSNILFEKLAWGNFLPAPTAFYKKSLIEEYDYYDTDYPMIEDYPMWLKLTYAGEKLYFLDKITVFYRVHKKSLSNIVDKIINEKVFEFRKKIYTQFLKDKIKNPFFHYCEAIDNLKYTDIIKKGNKKITTKAYLTYLIDPRKYLGFLRKIRNMEK
ncbi:MAG: glycosyltransferase [Cetobacterium sp.]